jgi:hypothetical protein
MAQVFIGNVSLYTGVQMYGLVGIAASVFVDNLCRLPVKSFEIHGVNIE